MAKVPAPKKWRTVKVKLYAVVQPDMLKDMPLAKVFTRWPGPTEETTKSFFVDAVFSHEYAAEIVAERYAQLKVKVVPCTLTFQVPDRRRKKA